MVLVTGSGILWSHASAEVGQSGTIRLACTTEIPEGAGREFKVGERYIAIFRSEGHFYAIEDDCPHAGAPLNDGAVHQGIVACLRHGCQAVSRPRDPCATGAHGATHLPGAAACSAGLKTPRSDRLAGVARERCTRPQARGKVCTAGSGWMSAADPPCRGLHPLRGKAFSKDAAASYARTTCKDYL